MHFGNYFQLILVILTGFSGLIYLTDVLFIAKKRKKAEKKMPIAIDYARSFFPIFLIVLVIRSFIIQPYRVPTGSLEPTILPNDFVAVSQFAYGLRLPLTNKKILSIGEPKKGDIAVFRYPLDPHIDYIKRVIGTPGDHIIYKNRTLYINGKKLDQKFLRNSADFEPPNTYIPASVKQETINHVTHKILVWKKNGNMTEFDLIVPKGQYFMMGDNRDNSGDSRYWGFVPEKDLVGKAFIIWFSWNSRHYKVRWHRIGTKL